MCVKSLWHFWDLLPLRERVTLKTILSNYLRVTMIVNSIYASINDSSSSKNFYLVIMANVWRRIITWECNKLKNKKTILVICNYESFSWEEFDASSQRHWCKVFSSCQFFYRYINDAYGQSFLLIYDDNGLEWLSLYNIDVLLICEIYASIVTSMDRLIVKNILCKSTIMFYRFTD